MSVFDINNVPSQPDSDLDPDLGRSAVFVIADEEEQDIAPGDWVDIDPTYISPDPEWGYSFQVCAVYPNENLNQAYVGILVCLNPTAEPEERVYAETALSPSTITNNFRRVPRVG